MTIFTFLFGILIKLNWSLFIISSNLLFSLYWYSLLPFKFISFRNDMQFFSDLFLIIFDLISSLFIVRKLLYFGKDTSNLLLVIPSGSNFENILGVILCLINILFWFFIPLILISFKLLFISKLFSNIFCFFTLFFISFNFFCNKLISFSLSPIILIKSFLFLFL